MIIRVADSSPSGRDTRRSGTQRRRPGVGSGAAALVAVLATVIGLWLFSGNGPQGPPGNDPQLLIPEDEVAAPADGAASGAEPQLVSTTSVPLDSVVVEEPTRLALNFRTGPTRCVGPVDTAQVVETDAAVTISLRTVPPQRARAGCAKEDQPEVRRTLRIGLDTSVTGRAVLDGAWTQQRRVERVSQPYEQP